jgi:hypothetical protein
MTSKEVLSEGRKDERLGYLRAAPNTDSSGAGPTTVSTTNDLRGPTR